MLLRPGLMLPELRLTGKLQNPIAAGLLLQLEAPPAEDQEASHSLYLLASLVAGALAPGPGHGAESMARDCPDGSPLRG